MEYEFSIVPENCRIEQKEFWYCYRYDIRNKYARSLFIFGYLEFKGSTIYKNIDLLEKLVEKLELGVNPQSIPELNRFHYDYLSDCIKICLCFENFIKYKLLTNGYSIHVIDKYIKYQDLDLNKPVELKELMRINKFDDDYSQRIPKMKKITYSLSSLIDNNNDFNKIAKLPSDFIPFLVDINEIRNKLHNCYEVKIKYSTKRIDIIKRMDKFLQSELNEEMNKFSI